MTAILFMDTETTGLSLDDDVWEFAAIRREDDGREDELHLFIEHDVTKCSRLPESFRMDHQQRFPQADAAGWHEDVASRAEAARKIALFTSGRPHIVGAVPNFDTERLALLLRAHGYEPDWHYHQIDVENLAVGYLAGHPHGQKIQLPWDSDAISRMVGVEPPGDGVRHTAMGDVRWAMAIYDRVMGGVR